MSHDRLDGSSGGQDARGGGSSRGGGEERERYRELLEEHRTILPGVQVLFAFLLTATFTPRFEQLDAFGRGLYAAALVGTALAAFLFLAPTSYHRVAPRQRRNERLRTGIRLSVTGAFVLVVSTLDAIFVVLRFMFHARLAAWVVTGLAAVVAVVWYLVPLWVRLTHQPARPAGQRADG